ncbi:hypothetical protein [Fluviicola sp.]|jgi:hypothetical protein|uniref:hypothetical protein n=1 Tax=Fluviicola sp. TaxID=1917219 RepID=UPI0031DF6DC1
MKKAFVALTLLMFVGSVSATYAADNTTVSIVKHDDKKGKKKKGTKKGTCAGEKSGGTCCQKKAA